MCTLSAKHSHWLPYNNSLYLTRPISLFLSDFSELLLNTLPSCPDSNDCGISFRCPKMHLFMTCTVGNFSSSIHLISLSHLSVSPPACSSLAGLGLDILSLWQQVSLLVIHPVEHTLTHLVPHTMFTIMSAQGAMQWSLLADTSSTCRMTSRNLIPGSTCSKRKWQHCQVQQLTSFNSTC